MKNKCKNCNKIIRRNSLCDYHYAIKIRQWRERSQYRQSLGLCGRCTEPKMPGKQHCLHHVYMFKKYSKKHRDIRSKLRGWKLVRIKL